ncbi:toxin glutamine deamidase domain-containing protein, partial [Streptomyces sp. NPDC059122]|uniref:toxin glutamine deamidase domain-containing protein n=1 Tax=Streptomyces sp. NPDC059122 TaxID=3346732 RepID=UPI0036AFCF5E
ADNKAPDGDTSNDDKTQDGGADNKDKRSGGLTLTPSPSEGLLAYVTIANYLAQIGPGASAVVEVNWNDGGTHQFNAVVDHNGGTSWADAQTGQEAELHSGNVAQIRFWPHDANGNEVPYNPQSKSPDTTKSDNGTPDNNQADNSDPATSPQTDTSAYDSSEADQFAGLSPNSAYGNPSGPPRPRDAPAPDGDPTRDGLNQPTSGRPDAPVPGTPDGRPGQTPPGQTSPDARPNDVRPNQTPPAARPKPPTPEAPAGKRKASGPPAQDNSDSNPVKNKKRKNEPDHTGLAALHLNDANVSSSASTSASPPKHDDDAMDVDKVSYSDPQDRGDSDTSKQEQEGKHTLDAEKEGSKEYGIPPDRLQNELRRDRDVHRIPLDRVHGNLDRWANDGSLAQVLRASTGDAKSPSPDAGKGPRAFPQSDLEKRLPGFKDLDRGERLAVVSSLARLSVGFHDQHGVGKNPEHIDKPYRNKGEGDPQEKTKDSVAKNSDESLGVRGHRKSSEKFLDNLKVTGNMPPSLRHNSPDLTDRNYAVLEVEGPPPERETHYVSDSSVPVGEKYVSGRHSEKHLVDWLKRVNQGDKQYALKSVYTEREPCGNGQGHAKCSTVLRSQGLDGTKVYYSTTYRTDPEDVAAKKRLDIEKKVEKKKVDGMVSTEVRENLEDRINSRTDRSAEWRAKEIAAAKAKSDADVREDLRKDVEREFKKRKEDATTDAKHAMVREMDRHIDHLDSLWTKIQPSLM